MILICMVCFRRDAETFAFGIVALPHTNGVVVKRARTPARTHMTWPEPLEALRPFTALYLCYQRWASKQLWSIAQLNRLGSVKCDEIVCVPGPNAELFLTHLENMYGIEIDSNHADKLSNVTHSLNLIESSHLRDFCQFERYGVTKGRDNVRVHCNFGDLHVIAGAIIDWVEPTDIDGMSRLKVTAIAWQVTASDADVRNGSPPPSVSRWMEVVDSAKVTVRAWAEEMGDDATSVLSPRLLKWVEEPTVSPVTGLAA